MDVETNKAIGRCLRNERKARKLQQQDVAAAMGRPQSFVSKLENGERKFVLAEIFAYARALGMSAHDLLDDVEGALTLPEPPSKVFPGSEKDQRYHPDPKAKKRPRPGNHPRSGPPSS